MSITSPPPVDHRLARLPSRLTPFIGRHAELERVLQLMEDPSVRLVTLTGVGGVGKTALALEIASRLQDKFEHGAAFVPLAQLNSVDDLLPALADALDVQLPPSGELQQAVMDQLSGLQALLVLDTFEHLLDEAVLLRDLLLAAPRVKILVTSREKLNLEAETLFNLAGLELPPSDDPADAPECDSLRLFVQRAHQVRSDFSLDDTNMISVARICRMVDGNPLGILLAASWVEHFSPAEILAEATSSLDFLAKSLRDVEPRHSCLRAVFESSFKRLDESQKKIFRRLSVFHGGFNATSARVIANADLPGLISLVEKSMLTRVPESSRYELHGLLQQYAREELAAAGELERTLAAHTAYYCAFVRKLEPRMVSGRQAGALDEMQIDFENIRQAWAQVIAQHDFESARRMLPGLYAFCDMRTRFYEGEAMFRLAAEGLAPHAGMAPNGAWALALLSWFDMHTYIERSESYMDIAAQARSCLKHCRSIRDAQATAASLVLLGAIAEQERDFKTAIERYEEAMRVYPALRDAYWVDMRIGLTYEAMKEYDAAIEAFQACLRRGRETGEKVKQGWALQNIGDTLIFLGKVTEAQIRLEQALALFQEIGTRNGVVWSTHSLSRVAWAQGNPERAMELAQAASQAAHQIHSASWVEKTDDLLRQLNPELAPALTPGGQSPREALSERELEVLRLLKSEMSGPEIARSLVVSLNTVRFHTKHIYQKLGVNGRLEAIRRAKELGL